MPDPTAAPLLFPLIVAFSAGFPIGLSKGGLSGLGAHVTPLFSLAMPDVCRRTCMVSIPHCPPSCVVASGHRACGPPQTPAALVKVARRRVS